MARAKEKKAKGAASSGIQLDAHPRARRQINMAKAWGGLAAFAIVLYLSRGAGLPFGDALLRGLFGGIAGYLVGWVIAVTVWRHIALAEIEELRGRLLAKMAADAEADARAQAAQGDGASATTMVSQT
jgi:uncharacterized membrane protein YccC